MQQIQIARAIYAGYACIPTLHGLTLALSRFSNAVFFSTIDSSPVTADLLWPTKDGPSCKFPRFTVVAAAGLLNIVGMASGLICLLFCIPNCDAMRDPCSKQSFVKCSLQWTEYLVASLQLARVLCTCLFHCARREGMLIPSVWVLEQPAATQCLTIPLLEMLKCKCLYFSYIISYILPTLLRSTCDVLPQTRRDRNSAKTCFFQRRISSQ